MINTNEVRGRLQFIIPSIIAVLAFVVSLFFIFLPKISEIGIEKKKEAIIEQVQVPLGICEWFLKQVAAGLKKEAAARAEAASIIRSLRYGKSNKDYFWVLDDSGVLIVHPYRSDLEGKDVADYRDNEGVLVFAEMIAAAEDGGSGFVSYNWQLREKAELIEEKISYVRYFSPWGWVIGTGMYLEEVEQEINTIRRSMIYISAAVMLVVSGLLFFIIRRSIREQNVRFAAVTEQQKSEDRYRRLVDLMHEGIVVQNIDGRFTYVNRQFCNMLGYAEDELIGQSLSNYISDEQLGSFLAEMDKRREGKDPVYRTEWKRKDGGVVSTNVSPRILYNDNNEPNGSYAVVTDINDLIKAENELRGLLQEKTILLKEIHHRVKNNLQLISSLFNLQLHNSEDEEVKNLLSASQSRILTMCRIHEFLYQSDNFREVEMKGFLEHLIYDIESIFLEDSRGGIEFSIQADVACLTVNQAVPCGLIMNELISNAVKHAFLLEKENPLKPNITVFLRNERDGICFGVEDNGKGVSSKLLNSVNSGTGMRLITVLTEQLGGTVHLKPGRRGNGSRIEIAINSRRRSG